MDLIDSLRIQAHANRLANLRLHAAMAKLSHAAFHAARIGFFPTLAQTLNHILAVDLYYVGALHADPQGAQIWERFVPSVKLADLVECQAACDERLIAFCAAMNADAADAIVDMDRGTHVQSDKAGHVLAHLFMHQTHHRGLAHAMLSGTDVAPPQLDEFLMPSDARFRQVEMARLGWSEPDVYGA